MKQLNVRVTEEEHRRLKAVCAQKGRTIQSVAHALIMNWVSGQYIENWQPADDRPEQGAGDG